MTIHVTAVDMSTAFDTIHRVKLLEIAEEVLSEDGARMLIVLLTDATIEIEKKCSIYRFYK